MPVTIGLGPVPACWFSGGLRTCKSLHQAPSAQAKGLCLMSSVTRAWDPACLTPVKGTNNHLLYGRGGNGSSNNFHTDSEIHPYDNGENNII